MDDWTSEDDYPAEDDCPDSLSEYFLDCVRRRSDDIAKGERLADVYANDMIVKYLIRPMALHAIETLLFTVTALIGFPFTCGFLSSADVCDRHYNDLFIFTYFFFGFLFLYMIYLERVRPRRGLRKMRPESMV